MLTEVAIGAVIHNDVLTISIRQGNELAEPIQAKLGNPLDAVALLLAERVRHRHDDPIIYLESNSTAGAVLEGIRERDEQSRDQIVNGLSGAASYAGAGVAFYDRRSELHYRFLERVAHGKLLVPAVYNDQLIAFAEEIKDGKIFFPYVRDVAQKLGRWPAFAITAVLATLDVPPRRDDGAASRRDHDPYAKLT